MHKHRIYHKGSVETFSCKIIKWLQIVLLSYGDFYTLIRHVRKTLIYSHFTIYSKIKYNKNPNNNIKSTHPNFSYFLNHIQSLISKTLIYLQQITNTVSKLLKTAYIYRLTSSWFPNFTNHKFLLLTIRLENIGVKLKQTIPPLKYP